MHGFIGLVAFCVLSEQIYIILYHMKHHSRSYMTRLLFTRFLSKLGSLADIGTHDGSVEKLLRWKDFVLKIINHKNWNSKLYLWRNMAREWRKKSLDVEECQSSLFSFFFEKVSKVSNILFSSHWTTKSLKLRWSQIRLLLYPCSTHANGQGHNWSTKLANVCSVDRTLC